MLVGISCLYSVLHSLPSTRDLGTNSNCLKNKVNKSVFWKPISLAANPKMFYLPIQASGLDIFASDVSLSDLLTVESTFLVSRRCRAENRVFSHLPIKWFSPASRRKLTTLVNQRNGSFIDGRLQIKKWLLMGFRPRGGLIHLQDLENICLILPLSFWTLASFLSMNVTFGRFNIIAYCAVLRLLFYITPKV